jgi:hypothetical protein
MPDEAVGGACQSERVGPLRGRLPVFPSATPNSVFWRLILS